jgi:hypothetical protein
MQSQLLPVDGFSYETAYGRFVAKLIVAPSEVANPKDAQKFEIELWNLSHSFCPPRGLKLLVSLEDLEHDRAGVFRLIQEWAFADVGEENFFEFEYHYTKRSREAGGESFPQAIARSPRSH